MRISKDQYYLNIAKAVAARSTCLKRRYGCVIVKDDVIISTGYNGSPRDAINCCDIYTVCPRIKLPSNVSDYSDCNSIHAEQNALISAPGDRLIGAKLYLYGEKPIDPEATDIVWEELLDPEACHICYRMIRNSGIKSIINATREILF